MTLVAAPESPSKVATVASLDEFYDKLTVASKGMKSGHKDGDLVCIKFYSSWCKSCKAIAPKYDALADKYDDRVYFCEMRFTKDMKETFSDLQVKKMPSFQFWRGEKGRLETKVCGPSKFREVGRTLEKYLEGDIHDPLECELDKELRACIADSRAAEQSREDFVLIAAGS